MEARDPRSRIRPLPPKTHSGAPPPGPPSPFALRRLGVAVAVAAVVALIALFGVVSARSGNDAAAPATTTTTRPPPIVAGPASTTTTTTTTTTTLPPTLADMAPALTDGLTLVVRDQLSGTVQRWAPGDRTPRPVQLTSRPDRASFDPSGTWLLYETSSGPTAAVHVGGQTSGQPAAFVGVRGAQWHPTRPGTVAWVAQLPVADVPSLYVATVGAAGSVAAVDVVAALPEDASLVAYGDWGFAIEWRARFVIEPESETGAPFSVDQTVTSVLATDGTTLRTFPGPAAAASNAGVLVVVDASLPAPLADYFTAETVGEVASSPGQLISIVDTDFSPSFVSSFEIDQDAIHFVSDDGEWLVQVSPRTDGRVDITANGLTRAAVRSIPLAVPATPVGFSTDGTYLVLQELSTNDALLIDWRRSRLFRIPVAQGTVVAAAPL